MAVDGTTRWVSFIDEYSPEVDVPPAITRGVMRIESDGDPASTGSPGVVGLMQIKAPLWPELHDQARHEFGASSNDALYRDHPEASIWMGVRILRFLFKTHGSWSRAIVAYQNPKGLTNPDAADGIGTSSRRYFEVVRGHVAGYDPSIVLTDPWKETAVAGLTPWPAFKDRPLPDKFGAGMSWLHRFPQVGSYWHSMVGWLWSTDAYFRLFSVGAATDWGIGGQGDGADDGTIFRWIDVNARPNASPWASGWDSAPDYDDQGRAFVERFGVRGVNPGSQSIEFSGLVNTPVTAKQWASGIHLTAAIHHRILKQSWDEFAWNMHHREVAEKDCPFPRIYKYTEEYQKAIVLIMRHFETGFDIPDFSTIAGLRVPLPQDEDDGPVTPPKPPIFVAFAKPMVLHTRTNVPSRQWGHSDAEIVKRYPKGTAIRCPGYYLGEDWKDDDRWLVIKSTGPSNNARIHSSHVIERWNDEGIVPRKGAS